MNNQDNWELNLYIKRIWRIYWSVHKMDALKKDKHK